MYHQPIVIVKPEQSSSEFYERPLAGFTSQRVCTSGTNAMQAVESAPASVVVIESALEDMDAVDLAEMIRDIDTERHHFTYIVIVGETLTPEIAAAFTNNVDAFVSFAEAELLAATASAGARLSALYNELTTSNMQLEEENKVLLDGQLLDPLTGLGNQKMAILTLEDSIAQTESRGGAVCLLLIAVDNLSEVIGTYDRNIADEFIQSIAERVNSLVRPMDTVTYFEEGLFALVLVQPSIDQCTAECYARIFDGIRLKSFRTSIGYLEPRVGMSICASHAENGPPLPERMISTARDGLASAIKLQKINLTLLAES